MACAFCSVELHSTCRKKIAEGECCCEDERSRKDDDISDEVAVGEPGFREDSSERRNVRRHARSRKKRESSLRDQQSTGRKRAAVLYPLDRTAPCEWQGLKFAGGSRFPIVGCLDGLQQARHHGPDKNTLNNDEGNVHRICHNCHNRWHTLNDVGYEWDGAHSAHDTSQKATLEEIMMNELKWAGKPLVKARD